MSYSATFSPDLSVSPSNADVLSIKAGEAATIPVQVAGFATGDTITSIKLYAKVDATDADNATNTIALTGVLTTPSLLPNSRLATFSLTSSNTTSLLTGRVYRVEVIATRSAVQYTRTVLWGMIGAAYPGNTAVAPSDEAALRAQGDATVLSLAGSVAGGGTGVTTYTTGDLLYASAANTLAKLAGNTTTSKEWLTQTGTGLASAAPAWSVIASADITDATTSNVPNTVVLRGGSGNFSAGIITAALTGNASTATALQTPRAINGVNFDGTAAITITAATTSTLAFGAHLTGTSFNGSAPITIATDATNLNTVSTIVARDGSGNFVAGTITAALTGNASTATALATPRAINGVNFDGTAAITVTAAAGTLTGTTLAAAVVASSLTSVGTLTALSVAGAIAMTAAVSKIVPGATSFSHRNTADSADNLLITDAGAVTVRAALTVNGGTGSGGTTALFGAIALPASLASSFAGANNWTVVSADINDGTARGGSVAALGYGSATRFVGARAQGVTNAPTTLTANNIQVQLAGAGYDGTNWAAGANVQIQSAEVWNATSHGAKILFNVVANTTTTVATALTLDQDKSAAFAGTIGFNGTTPIAKPTVSGSKGANAALASLMTALSAYGLVTDTTT